VDDLIVTFADYVTVTTFVDNLMTNSTLYVQGSTKDIMIYLVPLVV